MTRPVHKDHECCCISARRIAECQGPSADVRQHVRRRAAVTVDADCPGPLVQPAADVKGRRVGGQANNGTRPGAAPSGPRLRRPGIAAAGESPGRTAGARRPSRRTLRPGPDCPAAARNRPRSAVRPRGISRPRTDLSSPTRSPGSRSSASRSPRAARPASMRRSMDCAGIARCGSPRRSRRSSSVRESRRNAPRPAGCSRQGACGRFGRNRTWQTASLPWRSVCLSSSAAAPGGNPILERLAHLGARPMRYICQRCLEPHGPDSLGLSRSCNLGA